MKKLTQAESNRIDAKRQLEELRWARTDDGRIRYEIDDGYRKQVDHDWVEYYGTQPDEQVTGMKSKR